MLTGLVILILSVAILVVLLLVIVVIGISQEPPAEELSEQAGSLTAAFVRRLLGVHVRKPDSPPNVHLCDERRCLATSDPALGPNAQAGPK